MSHARLESTADATARRAVHANAVLWRDLNDRLAGQARSWGQSETCAKTVAADGTGSHLRQTAAIGACAGTLHLSLSAAGFDDRQARHVLGRSAAQCSCGLWSGMVSVQF
jgi:hypothetical protein